MGISLGSRGTPGLRTPWQAFPDSDSRYRLMFGWSVRIIASGVGSGSRDGKRPPCASDHEVFRTFRRHLAAALRSLVIPGMRRRTHPVTCWPVHSEVQCYRCSLYGWQVVGWDFLGPRGGKFSRVSAPTAVGGVEVRRVGSDVPETEKSREFCLRQFKS